MQHFTDVFNKKIRLSDERANHLIETHPEIKSQIEKIKETLLNPDLIIQSKTDDEVDLYYKYYLVTTVGEKYLCVVVKVTIDDSFIITAYFTDSIKGGEILWKKK